jgi:hypothetical protein
MSTLKQISDQIKKDGISLTEDELQSVVRLLTSLAKIEYEVYREQKSDTIHCQSTEPQEIGHNHKNQAA